MKKYYLSLFQILLLNSLCLVSVNAQLSCDNANVLIQDNFESYQEGALGPQADHWTTWTGTEGGDEDAIVNNEFSNSGLQSFKIEGDTEGGPQDVILKLGDKTTGMYVLEWQMYIIETLGAYFNLQHFEQNPGEEYAIEVIMHPDGNGTLSAGATNTRTFPFPQNEWFRVRLLFDMDNDLAYMWIGNKFIYSWPVSWQNNTASGTKQLGAVNYYAIDDTHWFYVDDVYFAEVPTPEEGKYCHTAIPIETGTHAVGVIDCFGAGFTVRSDGQGQAGAWYSYTPEEDGILSVSSCGEGGDTRVWIFSGGCENLNIEGVNDDLCEIDAPDEKFWASYREVLVTGGETYLIVWDDIWENGNFNFTLEFSTSPPGDGDFCESAIAVQPGTHTIELINGNAAVSGPNMNHTSASTTNYAQSEWYSFTPETEGTINVSTCNLTTEDTRLWIYKGICGIENLELIASNDDGCDFQSVLSEIEVNSGTTYYIEWDSEATNAPGFDWELEFNPVIAINELSDTPLFNLSPNPASEEIYLYYNTSTTTNLHIDLLNHTGQLINSKTQNNATTGNFRFDVSELPSGIYFFRIREGSNVFSKKFVVER